MEDSFRSAASHRTEKSNIFNNFDPDLPDEDEILSQSSSKSNKRTSYPNQNQYNRNQQNYNNYNQQGQWNNQQRPQRFNNNQNDNYGYQKNNNNWHNGQKFQNNNQGYNNKHNNYNTYNNYNQKQGYGQANNYGYGPQANRNPHYLTQRDHFPHVDIKKELGGTDFQVPPVDKSWSSEMNTTTAEAKLFEVNVSLIGFDNKRPDSSGIGSVFDERDMPPSQQKFEGTPGLKTWFLRGERVYMQNIGEVQMVKMKIKPDCAECTIKRFIELDSEKGFMVSKRCKVCYVTSKNTITTSLNRVFQRSENQAIFAKISTSGAKDIKIEDIEKVILSIKCADCGSRYSVEIPPEKEKNKKSMKKEEVKTNPQKDDKDKGKKKLRVPGGKAAEEEKHEEEENIDDLGDDEFVISYNVACSTWNCYRLLIFEVKRFSISSKDLEPAKAPPPEQEIAANK